MKWSENKTKQEGTKPDREITDFSTLVNMQNVEQIEDLHLLVIA